MKTLKVLSGVFLAVILFLSLVVFGVVFTVKMTVLNAGFVSSQLDNLPVSSLIREVEFEELIENPGLAGYLEEFLAEHEPEIKDRMAGAISDAYDYLLGRSEELDLAETLGATVLDPQLTIELIQGLDKVFLVEEFFSDNILVLIGDWPDGFPVMDYLDDAAVELEPWINEQVAIIVPPAYDYILGKSQELSVVISLEPAIDGLRTVLRQAFLESPPAELAGLPPALLEQEFNTRFEQFSENIPTAFTLDERRFNEIRTELTRALGDAEEALAEARKYVGYFQLGFGLLIGFIVLLVAGIILIYREVRASTRVLGIVFLVYGTLELVGIFIARSIARAQITATDIPPSVQEWLVRLVGSSLTPLLILVIILLLAGAALVAVSFIYRPRRQPE
jgi:hypothetical protein